MCNHSQVTLFDGQEFCNLCNEELDTNTGLSLSEERIDEDDDSGEGDWVEREEEHYLNSFGE